MPTPPTPPLVIKIEPTPEEVHRAAQQEATERRIFGEPPEVWTFWFTIALIASNGLLWWATQNNASAAKRAAEVAERALIGVERPILLIEVDPIAASFNGPYQVRQAQVKVRNLGRLPAINQRCVTEIMPRRKPVTVPKPGVTPFTSDRRIGLDPGQIVARDEPPAQFEALVALDTAEYRREEIDSWSVALYLIGIIDYTDIVGTERECGFTFRYVPTPKPDGQWRRIIDPGYNFDQVREPKK